MLALFFHQPTEERYMMLALLLALRVVNALTSRTFFQPDEYYQSLEPAWQLAFGDAGNAWITWVYFPLLLFCISSIQSPSLLLGSGLTMPAGVEKPIAVVPASSNFCRYLSCDGEARGPLGLESAG
jgi:hypothetical protein